MVVARAVVTMTDNRKPIVTCRCSYHLTLKECCDSMEFSVYAYEMYGTYAHLKVGL